MNPVMHDIPKAMRAPLLARERKWRASGDWGPWQVLDFLPGTIGKGGWTAYITRCHKNRVFAVLDRQAEAGVRHLAVSSLSGIRPTWPEMQRIKDELAGADATAIEVYPPKSQIVDEADMFHIWVLRGKLPFGLHVQDKHPAIAAMRSP